LALGRFKEQRRRQRAAAGRFPARARLAGGEEGVEEVGGGECYLLVGLLAFGAAGGGESAAQGWRRWR